MTHKNIMINKEDVMARAVNILNKVAESRPDGYDINVKSHYQPDGMGQDNALIEDAFMDALNAARRRMAAYVDDSLIAASSIELSPGSITLPVNGGSPATLHVYCDGGWELVQSDSVQSGTVYVIRLLLPDTWLDDGTIEDNVRSFVRNRMIAEYLESVDKKEAAWYRAKSDALSQDMKNGCEMRRPGTKFNTYHPWEG